jgi:hypothetical protein
LFSGACRKAEVSEWHGAKLTLKIQGKGIRYFILWDIKRNQGSFVLYSQTGKLNILLQDVFENQKVS